MDDGSIKLRINTSQIKLFGGREREGKGIGMGQERDDLRMRGMRHVCYCLILVTCKIGDFILRAEKLLNS